MADKKMKMQELEVPDQYGGERTVKFYGDQTEEQARKNWAKHLERLEARRKRRMERGYKKGGFIATGCGKVMGNRRKKTRIF